MDLLTISLTILQRCCNQKNDFVDKTWFILEFLMHFCCIERLDLVHVEEKTKLGFFPAVLYTIIELIHLYYNIPRDR